MPGKWHWQNKLTRFLPCIIVAPMQRSDPREKSRVFAAPTCVRRRPTIMHRLLLPPRLSSDPSITLSLCFCFWLPFIHSLTHLVASSNQRREKDDADARTTTTTTTTQRSSQGFQLQIHSRTGSGVVAIVWTRK